MATPPLGPAAPGPARMAALRRPWPGSGLGLRASWRGWRTWWFPLFLSGVVLALYLPSLSFGLIWDDPTWYRQGQGLSLGQILTSLSTFQFYRPLTILLNRLFVAADGTVRASAAHLFQVCAHLLAALMALPTLRALGLRRIESRLGVLIFALHPFSYQAVAWQAPQQPLSLFAILAAYLLAERYAATQRCVWLIASAAVYGCALLLQESALPFVVLFAWPAIRQWRRSRRLAALWWPALHGGLAMAYAVAWLLVPKRAGVTGPGLNPRVLAYLLQGVAYPLARAIAALRLKPPVAQLTALLALAWLALAPVTWRRDRGRSGLVASGLIALGLAPVWVGLSWDYVRVGSRLLYPAALGVGALWGRWLAWGWADEPPLRHWTGRLAAVGVVALSLGQWARFQQLYTAGTAHLARTIATMAAQPDERLLMINFPDRLEIRPRLYPLGYWGLTLAPIDQPLRDYALATAGRAAQTRSYTVFAVGADERDRWLYRVDMRGEGLGPVDLLAQIQWANAVYLTEYGSGGALALRWAGGLGADDGRPALARFDATVELVDAAITRLPDEALQLALQWRALRPIHGDDTVFVHVLNAAGQFVADRDGDALGALV
ncbi:MAG: hypothetical protein V1772_06165, partial [Chloroflexota bacterium]